ncbi:acyl carrier protein [Permianibacter aggregans]|uniref:Acyl carrier protein n=1 Tax=Permianibacter aggregans TaxID=1510150 RepID=A0A4R6UG86_9GAMM|nr:acyl carrier protein [Permianibacter aggregans]QGX40305.1 acyl carrier protein [Permianibacter aggregans]TDQ44223.1 acyl carrier protein [Permianibacter aggregans]
MNTENEILATLKTILQETFEVDPSEVTLDSNLYQDLDLDSIDAVDLVIKLQEITGKKIKPEEFKQVRTVGDVVRTVHGLMLAA